MHNDRKSTFYFQVKGPFNQIKRKSCSSIQTFWVLYFKRHLPIALTSNDYTGFHERCTEHSIIVLKFWSQNIYCFLEKLNSHHHQPGVKKVPWLFEKSKNKSVNVLKKGLKFAICQTSELIKSILFFHTFSSFSRWFTGTFVILKPTQGCGKIVVSVVKNP